MPEFQLLMTTIGSLIRISLSFSNTQTEIKNCQVRIQERELQSLMMTSQDIFTSRKQRLFQLLHRMELQTLLLKEEMEVMALSLLTSLPLSLMILPILQRLELILNMSKRPFRLKQERPLKLLLSLLFIKAMKLEVKVLPFNLLM